MDVIGLVAGGLLFGVIWALLLIFNAACRIARQPTPVWFFMGVNVILGILLALAILA